MLSTVKIEVDWESQPIIKSKLIESDDVRDQLVRNFHQRIYTVPSDPAKAYYTPMGICSAEFVADGPGSPNFSLIIRPLNYVDIAHESVQRILRGAAKDYGDYQAIVHK